MSIDHSSYVIDELALCKLIAHELSEGPHSVEEIYGMLILILRMKDKRPPIYTSLVPETQHNAPFTQEAVHTRFTDYNTLPIPPLGG